MPPKRTTWWQVTLYIINDVIGAWVILFSSYILAIYGWILGIALLVAVWPLHMYTEIAMKTSMHTMFTMLISVSWWRYLI